MAWHTPTVFIENDIDCGAMYERTRLALLDLVQSLPDQHRQTTVSATPEWSVQDVVAHVIGIASSLNAGEFPTGDPDTWARAQVESRRGRSLEQLRAEWDAEAPDFEDGMRIFGYDAGSHFLGDLLQHYADVRHALALGRICDDDALTASLDFYLDSFHQSLAGIGSVEVRAADDAWVLGAGPEVATVTADRFELLRALGGRRSEAQIRGFEWTGAVHVVAPLVSRYGPSTGIVEP